MSIRRGLISVIAMAGLGLAVYQWRFAPITVSVAEIVRRPVEREVTGTGTLFARTRIAVSPKLPGRIAELTVDQNDPVAEGQILARLDDSDLLEQVAIAKAVLEAAKAAQERAKADDGRAEAVLDQAKLEHERAVALQPRSLAQREVDKSLERLRIAEAEKSRSEAQIVEASRQVDVCERTHRYQQARLSDTVIRSPFAGLIVRRDRAAGDIVVPGAEIFELISTGEIWVSAWVEESAMNSLAPGQPVKLAFRSDRLRAYTGTVVRTSREVDRETRELLVDIRPDALPARWAVGQRVDVRIVVERRPDALALPADLLRWRDGRSGVFAVRDGRAEWRPLVTIWTGDPFAVVDSGLAEGERVIVPSAETLARLSPGRRVTVAK